MTDNNDPILTDKELDRLEVEEGEVGQRVAHGELKKIGAWRDMPLYWRVAFRKQHHANRKLLAEVRRQRDVIERLAQEAEAGHGLSKLRKHDE